MYGRVGMRATGETSFDEAGLYEEDACAVFDARIDYLTGGWNFYVHGKNLTDEEYLTNFTSGASYTMAEFGQPLTIGAGLHYRICIFLKEEKIHGYESIFERHGIYADAGCALCCICGGG